MELHPTPESWRIALGTAAGALLIVAAGLVLAATSGGSTARLVAGLLIAAAALATLLPAVGTVSATIDADTRGITVHRLGRSTRFPWSDVVDLHVIERPAQVPDGTEYHWVVPRRSRHVVAVPCLALADGRCRELPALAGPASGPNRAAVSAAVEALNRFRTQAASSAGAQLHAVRHQRTVDERAVGA